MNKAFAIVSVFSAFAFPFVVSSCSTEVSEPTRDGQPSTTTSATHTGYGPTSGGPHGGSGVGASPGGPHGGSGQGGYGPGGYGQGGNVGSSSQAGTVTMCVHWWAPNSLHPGETWAKWYAPNYGESFMSHVDGNHYWGVGVFAHGQVVEFWLDSTVGETPFFPLDVCDYGPGVEWCSGKGNFCDPNGAAGVIVWTVGPCTTGSANVWWTSQDPTKGWVDNPDELGPCTSNGIFVAP